MRGPKHPAPTTPASISGTWRAVISVLLTLHLLAIFFGTWSAVPPYSRLGRRLGSLARPYLEATYLNHGYRFFAPNPEASHLIRFEVMQQDGNVIEGRFPDPLQNWPRLYYHRHLMISETLFMLTNTPPLEESPPEQHPQILNQRALARTLVSSLRDNLLHEYDGQEVKLWLVEHQLPSPLDVINGQTLDDPALYVEQSLDEYVGPTP